MNELFTWVRNTTGFGREYMKTSSRCEKHFIHGVRWVDGASPALAEVRRSNDSKPYSKPIRTRQLPGNSTLREIEQAMRELHARAHVHVPPSKNRGRS